MEASSNRTQKFLKNSFVGVVSQLSIILLTFLVRYFFIKTLGDNVLGINGVFSSILSLLSVAELGFGATMLYSLYKPIAENNEPKINSIITYFGKIFNYVALIVLIGGSLASAFLPFLLHGEYTYLTFIQYFVYLLSVVVTYPLDYKSVILTAYQKDYIKKRNSLIISLSKSIVEILILIFLKDYLVYLIVSLVANVILNFINCYSAKKIFPQYFYRNYTLTKEEKNDIKMNVKALSFYKLFSVLINNVDNIYITIFVSTLVVGYYSNYNLVIINLNSLIYIIMSSLTVGVGNFLATTKSTDDRIKLFKKVNLLAFCLYGVISICLFCMFDEFVYLLGDFNKDCVLPIGVLICIILNFILPGLLNPISTFRDSSGLFKETKNCAIVFCVLNIVLSVLLGYFSGIFGILLATTLSRVLTIFWYEPLVIYKKMFNCKPYKFYIDVILKVLFCFAIGFLIKYINGTFYLTNLFVDFIAKCFLTFTFSIVFISMPILIKPTSRKVIFEYINQVFHRNKK